LQNIHTSKNFLNSGPLDIGLPDSSIIFPSIAYPTPSTSNSFPPRKTFTTVISFLVSVPVLSVQIMLTRPNVSTAFNVFTNAFLFAIFLTPILITTVITTIKPSGTAATAKLIAKVSAFVISRM